MKTIKTFKQSLVKKINTTVWLSCSSPETKKLENTDVQVYSCSE